MLWMLALAGLAEAACEPTDADRFSELVGAALTAIDDDDPLAHESAWRELQRHVPCLTVAVPSQEWAEFLYSLAVVQSLRKEPWEGTLDVALQTWPELPRPYGGPAIEGYEPAPVPPQGPPLPQAIWVDGLRTTAARELPGVHIVQRQVGGGFDNLLLRDEPLPEDWRVARPPIDEGGGAKRGRPGLAIVGSGLVVAGTATALAAYFPGKAAKDSGETPTGLTIANTAGWSVAGVGGVLTVLGIALPASQ